MSRLEGLLTQEKPLEPHEVADLEEWLSAMMRDCEDFGPTPDDIARMAAIEAKIDQSRAEVAA